MKTKLPWLALILMTVGILLAPAAPITRQQDQDIRALIDAYSQARAQQDRALMESILTADIDQLVSSGEWRRGRTEAMQGMSRSTATNAGTRTLLVESVRLLSPDTALVDARYEIRSPDGAARNMWSTFVVVHGDGKWKIAAIRNMLPSSP